MNESNITIRHVTAERHL